MECVSGRFRSIIATYLFSFLFLVVQKDEWPGSAGEFFSSFALCSRGQIGEQK